jgi:carbon starvation protein CstA
MIIADYLKIDQSFKKPFYGCHSFICYFLYSYKYGFRIIMEVFSWANQITAAIALWIGAVYLYQKKTHYIIALCAAFITSVVGSYLFTTLQLVLV